jgi:hypothetical protein
VNAENWITRSFMICTLAKYNWNNQVEEDEMDGPCSTNGEKRNAYRLLWESQRGRDH